MNTLLNNMDTALLNLLGNMHRISLTGLSFFSLFTKTKGCIPFVEGGAVRFCFILYIILLRIFIDMFIWYNFVDNSAFIGRYLSIG